ncbi:MAG: hypothetical protein KGH87_08365 [Thaumarchaeota archaeon]|nr:hypothetical protein [Nitrososphaerota archaeon]
MKYLPLLFIFAVISGGFGMAFAASDHSVATDDVQIKVVHGNAVTQSTGDSVVSTEAVPEFNGAAALVMAIAVLSMVVFAAKTRGIPKI